jgi:hypothetical protein
LDSSIFSPKLSTGSRCEGKGEAKLIVISMSILLEGGERCRLKEKCVWNKCIHHVPIFRRKEAENSWMLPGLEAQIVGEHKKVKYLKNNISPKWEINGSCSGKCSRQLPTCI